jgi:hypothetical protein
MNVAYDLSKREPKAGFDNLKPPQAYPPIREFGEGLVRAINTIYTLPQMGGMACSPAEVREVLDYIELPVPQISPKDITSRATSLPGHIESAMVASICNNLDRKNGNSAKVPTTWREEEYSRALGEEEKASLAKVIKGWVKDLDSIVFDDLKMLGARTRHPATTIYVASKSLEGLYDLTKRVEETNLLGEETPEFVESIYSMLLNQNDRLEFICESMAPRIERYQEVRARAKAVAAEEARRVSLVNELRDVSEQYTSDLKGSMDLHMYEELKSYSDRLDEAKAEEQRELEVAIEEAAAEERSKFEAKVQAESEKRAAGAAALRAMHFQEQEKKETFISRFRRRF